MTRVGATCAVAALLFAGLGYASRSASAQELCYLDRYQGGSWNSVPNLPFAPKGVAGDNKSGLLIAGGRGGRQVAFLNTYASGSWSVLPDAPFSVELITGNNRTGVIVASGTRVAYLSEYAQASWRETPRAPFSIRSLTGDNESGPIILSTDGVSIAHLDNYAQASWKREGAAPFALEFISGNNRDGVVGAGGRRAAALGRYGGPWQVIRDTPFPVAGLAGENKRGAIVIGQDGRLAIINDYRGNWEMVGQAAPLSPTGLVGSNADGVIALGSPRQERAPRTPPPAPADRQAPNVQIVGVSDGWQCQTQTLTVRVRARDDRGVTRVTVNGVAARSGGGDEWVADVQLQPGRNRLTASASDQAGNEGTATVHIEADWQPPQIEAGARATVTVEGRVDDPGAQVTVGGQPVSLDRSGRFRVEVPAPQNGFVEVVAVDRAGNRSVQRVPVR